MDNGFWEWTAGACLLGILILIGATAGLGKGDWSSWVQAIGSIAAIAAGFALAARQYKQTRQAEFMRLSQRLDTVALLVEALDRHAMDVFNLRHPDPRFATEHLSMDESAAMAKEVCAALGAVRLDELYSEVAAQAVLHSKSSIAAIDKFVERMCSEGLDPASRNLFLKFRHALDIHALALRAEAQWLAQGMPPRHRSNPPNPTGY